MVGEPWPRGRQRDGGIDQVPVPGRKGELWLCGKHLVGPDPEGALARVGGTVIACLTESHEIADRYPAYVAWLRTHRDRRAIWWPIPDLHAPSVGAASEFLDHLDRLLVGGDKVIMHCAAGIGRSGTMAAALLIRGGLSMDRALEIVASSRPMAGPEVGPQRDLLATLEAAGATASQDRSGVCRPTLG